MARKHLLYWKRIQISYKSSVKSWFRLAERLKTRFPRLPILLSMDDLFAGGPTFDLCHRFGWKLMIVLKDDDLPSVNEELDALPKLQLEKLKFIHHFLFKNGPTDGSRGGDTASSAWRYRMVFGNWGRDFG
jgi:hypothetical protein